MTEFNPQSEIPPIVLATDLDGTLIPLDNDADNIAALEVLKSDLSDAGIKLIYATGRHLESVESAVGAFQLPRPDWMICDVGTSIYRVIDDGIEPFEPYREHLSALIDGYPRNEVEDLFSDVKEITLQSPERQQQFKISYECKSQDLDAALSAIQHRLSDHGFPYLAIGSVDPFENCGLLDILPRGVTKGYAVTWLAEHAHYHPQEVVFAGDSGNDRAALISGFRAIVVGNASEELAREVQQRLEEKGCPERFYQASGKATSGVLEGCRHYGLLKR